MNKIDRQMRNALFLEVQCRCGDVRRKGDMCHICNRCQMGCCMCAEESTAKDKRIAELEGLVRYHSTGYRDRDELIKNLIAERDDKNK